MSPTSQTPRPAITSENVYLLPQNVTRVMTFKSGFFPFSYHYDRCAADKLLAKIGRIRAKRSATHMKSEAIRRSIYSTAAIEGNHLSEDQVGVILGAEVYPRQLTASEHEILNLKDAYAYCHGLAPHSGPFLLTEEVIRRIHYLLTKGIAHPCNAPGSYRNHKVQVGDKKHGGVYTPPKILPDIYLLMDALVFWANSDDLLREHPLVRAALVHFHLARVHPFSDGNGRTSRLIEVLCLQSHGLGMLPIMLSCYYHQCADEYYWAISQSEHHPDHDVTPFVSFVLRAAVAAASHFYRKRTPC